MATFRFTREEMNELGYSNAELDASKWQFRPWTDFDTTQFEKDMQDRHRLQCPHCGKIGTYKPRLNEVYKYPMYYVCKWCGYGRNVFGTWMWRPDLKGHHWGQVNENSGKTPQEIVHDNGNLDPWLG